MTVREQFYDLVLRAKNALTKPTQSAADSVEGLADSAEGLQKQLEQLEDQRSLITNFEKASKAVDRSATAYEKAQSRSTRLADQIDKTAGVARRQAEEFTIAEKAVDSAQQNYNAAQATLAKLAANIDKSGVATEKQAKEFAGASKSVDRTEAAYNKAQLRLGKLSDKMDLTQGLAARQAKEFDAAQASVSEAEAEYKRAEGTLSKLAKEAEEAGVDIANLGDVQRDNVKQTRAAERALSEYNDEVQEGGSRLAGFRKQLTSGISTFTKWSAAAVAAGAALTAGLIARFTVSQADLARQTLASASAFGISVQALQEWEKAGARVGIQGDKIADIMKDVAEKIGDAYINGGGEALEVIRGLNLDLEKLARLTPDQQILRIGEALQGLPKPAQIQIMEALANDASLLLPLLDNGAAKLRELAEVARERGQIFSKEELEELAEVNSTFRRITAQISTFAKRVAISLAPAFTRVGEAIDQALADSPELLDRISESLDRLSQRFVRFFESVDTSGQGAASSLATTSESMKGLGNTLLAIYKALQTAAGAAFSTIAFGAASLQALVVEALTALNAVGLATDESVSRAEARLNNLKASVEDLKKETAGYFDEMVAAGDAAATAYGKAKEGAVATAKATADAVASAVSLNESTEETVTATQKQARSQEALSRSIIETAAAIEIANAQWAADPTDENLRRIQELRAEYQALQDTLAGTAPPRGPDVDSGGVQDFRDNLEQAEDAANRVTDATRKTYSQVVVLGDEIESTGNAAEAAGDQAESSAGTVGAAIGAIFTGWSNRLSQLSARAAVAFEQALGRPGATGAATELEARLATVSERLQEMNGQVVRGGTVGRVLRDWATAGFETEQSFLRQAIAVEQLTDRIIEGDRNVSVLGKSVEDIEQQFDLLDRTQLSSLIGAVQSVQREIDGLSKSLDDTIASAQQELAALEGNTAEVERLRNLERENELQEQLNTARALGDAEQIAKAEEALRLTEQIFEQRLAEAKAQDEATRQQAARNAAEQERLRQQEETEEREDIERTERRTQTQTNQVSRAASSSRTVRIQFVAPEGQSLGQLDVVDDRTLDAFISALERSGYVVT